ncbi:MAG: argininosuccinate lyase [Verrucomicrobiales bacterium]|nr:argininosuccinate lyase [Verrucomicrobiales bacterium]
MWKGRFQEETTDLMKRFGESISFDWRLYKHDVRASIAHANGLVRAGILKSEEAATIADGLRQIEQEIAEGAFPFSVDLEDIHMNIEKVLTDRIGPAGAKLHTGRSRNDQVAVDMRLYALDAVDALSIKICALQSSLVGLGQRHPEAVLPGYTHLQRGQPVLLGHHLLAYVEMLSRDHGRLQDARERIDSMPLGSGALAGSTILIDREAVAKELGFSKVSRNSMDAVSDRDFMAEMLFDLALLGTHLSRLSEDVILWVSAEFDFMALSDAHTTGSSLMPQKKNPDAAELTRGKTGRLYGNLMALLTTLKGLPMTYNRDLQEDKERLFDSIDTAEMCLDIFTEMIAQATVKEASMRAAASDPFLLATDLADYLVKQGVPFRQAHEIIGKLTAYSLEERVAFPDMTLEHFQQFSEAFEESVFGVLNLDAALAAREAIGAPSPQRVNDELARWVTKLDLSAP